MPVGSRDTHRCIFCAYQASIRKDMKVHLTTVGKKGLRCSKLKKVLPVDIWTNEIVPHYDTDAKLPDLGAYTKVGRPRSPWTDASPRTKRRRTIALLQNPQRNSS